MSIKQVGVVGAGVMGTGLAQSLAQARFDVILLDISDDILSRARGEIRKNLRLAKMLDPQAMPESVDSVLSRITCTTEAGGFGAVDFVIENVVEKWAVKEQVYHEIDPICPPHAVFAANTSAISITRIASATGRPSQVLGMHFMNPVPMKPMVEVIRGYHTSEQTLHTARELLTTMGKSCVVVQDMPGFVSNRVLMLTINEAVFLLQDQVASAEDVDTIFRSCFGHKMGPLETADLIGLDTILYSIEVLYESYNDSKYRPCPLLKKMVDAGLHGRKNGRGFYTYE
ncbi:MAG: 3-hydroxyacyl-CoA dehydrogenase family protein [Chloroflexaceae bacterium]|jgi:3-hydroxybutyryl-CoA dehydrogenase|nr:3-hydroxyacyl-CoA dehydrogenase family protein [Chloroflexaceae bacterium]